VSARLTLCACLAATALAPAVRAEVREERFLSASLGREAVYSLQLPPSYASGREHYPVLYVLHGLFENHRFWERRGLSGVLEELWAKGEVPECVVVAVDGGDSFFVNGGMGRYQDLLTRDLIREVESKHRVLPGRDARALLGISMGGYAALRVALAQPGLFRAVAAHSAMLLAEPPTAADGAGRWHLEAFHHAFGDPIDIALWHANDPLALALSADPTGAPALSFDCGESDRYGLFAGASELHRRLTARGVPHSFALLPGDHGYEYVRSVLPGSLRFLGAALGGAPKKAP
jgi:S-formylglutathione hydrolase FrmB